MDARPSRAVEPIQRIVEQSSGEEVAQWVVEGCPELGVNAAPVRLLRLRLDWHCLVVLANHHGSVAISLFRS